MAFRDATELIETISTKVPRHLYYSSARYAYPAAKDMEEKGWLGSDMLFDVDADHICQNIRKISFCPSCGEVGDSTCPIHGQTTEFFEIDEQCLRKASENTWKLVEVLREDLGLEGKVYFSGNRGFHVHVECRGNCGRLGPDERREVVSYIVGKGIMVDQQVTVDIRRLTRIPGSLHGKSGLIVFNLTSPEHFSYGPHLSPFSGVSVFVPFVSVNLKVLETNLNLRRNSAMKVETGLAVHMSLKGLGKVMAHVK